MRTLFLVDNSVIQRLRQSSVLEAWRRLGERGTIATCLPTMLEAGYSARSAQAHEALMRLEQASKVVLPPAPEIVDLALRLQAALFAAGKGRAVGVSDLQIAATALYHSNAQQRVVVVHYDADFDHISSVEPTFVVEWIVPRGSVD